MTIWIDDQLLVRSGEEPEQEDDSMPRNPVCSVQVERDQKNVFKLSSMGLIEEASQAC